MEHKLKAKIESFFSRFPKKVFQKGDSVIDPDITPKEAFYLRKGYVRSYALSNQGVELTLHIFAPGSYFPMLFVLGETKNRYCYEALTQAEVYVIPKAKVLSFLRKESKVLEELTARLFQGVDKLLMRIEQLVFASASERVVSSLIFLARRFGRKDQGRIKIVYPFTHREIAAFAGVARETVSRQLESLQRDRVISYKHKLITITNLNKLKSIIV